MIEILIAFVTYVIFHTTIIVVCTKLAGIKILEIAYGVGPKIIEREVLKIGLLPIAGWVSLLDSREHDIPENEIQFAFNHKPWPLQVLVPFSSCIIILVLSFVFLGIDAFNSFAIAFKQIILGAITPFSYGKNQIANIVTFIDNNSIFTIIVIIQTKLVAFNLLPLSILNGGQALVNLLKMGRPEVSWEIVTMKISFLVFLLLLLSWGLAVIGYML